ncbi:hypothetical protein ACO0LM_12260 [Undibacterium sp. Di26W]|uniref:hypothetical protein n=1 Tax=Undibacterium sp. Di26W TaxID=3413035 RepID=UPI003BF1C7A8
MAFVVCRTLVTTIALRGYKPGLGPAAEFLSLLRQRTESKKGDRRLALRVLTLRFSIICASQKMGRSATRFPCRAHNRLQAIAVTQAGNTLPETPAAPQTSDLLFPFSVKHKLHCPKRIKVNNKVKSNVNTTVIHIY